MRLKTSLFNLLALALIPASPEAAPAVATPRAPREYRDFAMSHDGDLRRGKDLFFAENAAACTRCHTIDGSAGKAGPDLFAVGDKFPRTDMIRSLLEPSSEIAIGYGATLIETKSDESYTGIIKQISDSWIELMLGDGKSVRMGTNDIVEQKPSSVSLMPDGLQTGMSLQQFTDLIEFLITLKQPENALTSNREMPQDISELSKPVNLVPFFSEELRFPHSFVHQPGDVRSG